MKRSITFDRDGLTLVATSSRPRAAMRLITTRR
jgi:hypothetical protein